MVLQKASRLPLLVVSRASPKKYQVTYMSLCDTTKVCHEGRMTFGQKPGALMSSSKSMPLELMRFVRLCPLLGYKICTLRPNLLFLTHLVSRLLQNLRIYPVCRGPGERLKSFAILVYGAGGFRVSKAIEERYMLRRCLAVYSK
jgi:hypothetical protein